MKTRIGIAGYGNLGRGVEFAVAQNPDTELVAVFTRRNPETVKIQTEGVKVYPIAEAASHKDEIDVLILCGGSATDLPVQTPELAKNFNVIDSCDTHARIPEHFADVDKASIVAAGLRYYAFKNDGSDESGAFLGALLKGAGPIMHKMLQGLPLKDEALKAAVKDMKDNLAPIHEDVVKAELLAMVERSGGEITRIDVVKSLGCASVGQALLCNVTDKNGNTTQCVVK